MSEILAFSESADSDPKLSTEPVSESGDIHTATDVPPKEAPAPEPDSPEAETISSEEKKNTYTDFSSEDFKSSDDSEKDPFTGEKKSFHHHIFHTTKELNYLREKYILEKIPDDQLLAGTQHPRKTDYECLYADSDPCCNCSCSIQSA